MPEVCELPTEFQPVHEFPPLMSTDWAWAAELAMSESAAIQAILKLVMWRVMNL
jgi:hypothetical protein